MCFSTHTPTHTHICLTHYRNIGRVQFSIIKRRKKKEKHSNYLLYLISLAVCVFFFIMIILVIRNGIESVLVNWQLNDDFNVFFYLKIIYTVDILFLY